MIRPTRSLLRSTAWSDDRQIDTSWPATATSLIAHCQMPTRSSAARRSRWTSTLARSRIRRWLRQRRSSPGCACGWTWVRGRTGGAIASSLAMRRSPARTATESSARRTRPGLRNDQLDDEGLKAGGPMWRGNSCMRFSSIAHHPTPMVRSAIARAPAHEAGGAALRPIRISRSGRDARPAPTAPPAGKRRWPMVPAADPPFLGGCTPCTRVIEVHETPVPGSIKGNRRT